MESDYDYLITLNPNKTARKAVINAIQQNKGYCITQKERTEQTKCHCQLFKKTGICLCGLFVSVPVIEVSHESINGEIL